jgi:amino acid permease
MVYVPGVLNTANSLVGSGMLAMPFIIMNCGIILGPLLFLYCAWACEKACHLLVVLARSSQRESYEDIGKAVLGVPGRRASQCAMAVSMTNGMIVWMVVLGDIFPRLALKYNLIEEVSPAARASILIVLAATVIFPVSLLKNVMGSIAVLSQVSMGFYCVFALWIMSQGISEVIAMDWVHYVPWFRVAGIPSSIPIVSAAMTAQTQFFMVYQVRRPQLCRCRFAMLQWLTTVCAAEHALEFCLQTP